MRRRSDRLLRLARWVVPTLWFWTAPACNVPVFRYALERWEADPYQLVVFCDGPLPTTQQTLVQKLEERGADAAANLMVTRVDVTQEMRQPLRALWEAQGNPALPWMVLRYPKPSGIERSAWTGSLTAETVASLVESPVRREIARRLLGGDAVVWLLLESGNQPRDDQTIQSVETELRRLETSLVLPELSPADPPLNPALPLKIAFSTVRVARSDPAERMLVNQLLNWNTNLLARPEPMLFPIFGRGRAIAPAIGDEIRPEAIQDMAEFLAGPCSCEVKAMNPGYDLLLTANWNSLPAYQEIALPASPPLVGMSQFAAAVASNSRGGSPPAAGSLMAAAAAPPSVGRGGLVRNLVVVSAVGVIGVVAATLVLKARHGRKPR